MLQLWHKSALHSAQYNVAAWASDNKNPAITPDHMKRIQDKHPQNANECRNKQTTVATYRIHGIWLPLLLQPQQLLSAADVLWLSVAAVVVAAVALGQSPLPERS